jgi:acid phosphatase (class A)
LIGMKLILCGIAALAFFGFEGLAQTLHKPIFVSPQELDVASILPNPPTDDSPRTKAELEELRRLQDTRQAAQIAHLKADDVEEDSFIFKDVLGDKLTAAALPLAAIKPVCKTNRDIADYRYASGHSTTGYLEALVLIQIAPEKRDAILARADDYAHSRVVCGVHYPSDAAASKSVAYAMMGIMVNNPRFRKELEAARAETRQALGLWK